MGTRSRKFSKEVFTSLSAGPSRTYTPGPPAGKPPRTGVEGRLQGGRRCGICPRATGVTGGPFRGRNPAHEETSAHRIIPAATGPARNREADCPDGSGPGSPTAGGAFVGHPRGRARGPVDAGRADGAICKGAQEQRLGPPTLLKLTHPMNTRAGDSEENRLRLPQRNGQTGKAIPPGRSSRRRALAIYSVDGRRDIRARLFPALRSGGLRLLIPGR